MHTIAEPGDHGHIWSGELSARGISSCSNKFTVRIRVRISVSPASILLLRRINLPGCLPPSLPPFALVSCVCLSICLERRSRPLTSVESLWFAYRTADSSSSTTDSLSSCPNSAPPLQSASSSTATGPLPPPTATSPKTQMSSKGLSRLFQSPKLKCVSESVDAVSITRNAPVPITYFTSA